MESDGRLEHLALYLHLGSMVLSVNTGLKTLKTTASSGLNDGREHSVTVTLENEQIALLVDDGNCESSPCEVLLVIDQRSGTLELNQPLYLGGIGTTPLTPYTLATMDVTNNFIGCFQVC